MPIYRLVIISIIYMLSFYTNYAQEKIKKNTVIDGKTREYYIHKPKSYTGAAAVPMIFMLHGTGGNGEDMYQTSGWAELSEKEGFIVVFPSSLRFKIIDHEGLKTTTKWNTLPDADWTLQPGEVSYDDIKFLRTVIDEIKGTYKIDAKRIYLNGFSNGGQMAAKCSIEMSDILAAVCSNASSFFLDTVFTPKRKLPYLFQIGNRDYGPGNVGPEYPEVPMHLFDTLISTPGLPYLNGKHYRIATSATNNFSLKSKHTGIVGDTNFAVNTTYLPLDTKDKHEFKFVFVKDLGHSYPNWAPSNHWAWLKQYVLEDSTSSNAGFSLTIQDGHGTGQYKKGDTIHIWSKQIDGKVFTHWSGDIQYLESPNEYHSRVVMPNKNIIVTANFATLDASMKLSQVSIRGAKQNKNVFIYMPPKNKLKGVVWIFHGKEGNAANMTSNIETKQFIDLMMTKDYGIIGITSEESQDQKDYDGRGEIAWSFGLDSNLIDFANIRAIRDSLIRRSFIDNGTSHIAYGWSAGGGFAEYVVNVLNWKVAIAHTVPASTFLSLNAKKPFFLNINENDTPGDGPDGNAVALMNIKNYQSRGICAIFNESKKAPLYPERFDRSLSISETLSKSIFNEIKANNGLDKNNYFIGLIAQLKSFIAANPSKFPVIRALNTQQLSDLEDQVVAINAEHSVKADINGRIVEFIENFCSKTTPTKDEKRATNNLRLYPNPTVNIINMPNVKEWKIYNMSGQLLLKGKNDKANVSSFTGGIYYVISDGGTGKFVKE